MTSLLAEARAYRPGRSRCSVGNLDPIILAEVEEAFALVDTGEVLVEGISVALKARNIDVKGYTLARHHRRQCNCP